MNINIQVSNLIRYAIHKKLIQTEDLEYAINSMTYLLRLDDDFYIDDYSEDLKHVSIILDHILDYCFDISLFSPNTIKQRDLFESKIMSIFSSLPSDLNKTFNHLFNDSPIKATDYFYNLSKNCNYIKTARPSKNIEWDSETKYGNMSLAINLSKPEKDPRDIIKDSKKISTKYPMCVLCKENVGFYGNDAHPGRSNHRVIKLDLNDEIFHFQYSPYSYYNEHSILLLDKHIPMKVSIDTFRRLLSFVNLFPHYFLGSNAGLPIVGGSILSHEHYQGGKHYFPIEDARIEKTYKLNSVKLGILDWPISVIRLESESMKEVINVANKVFNYWENYTNESIGIHAYTDAPHNAITPIARKIGNTYIIDIALRNNLTSKEYPLGIFHTHEENQNIKKENIGLIEVMGLAILPMRLEEELSTIKKCIVEDKSLPKEMSVHRAWVKELKALYKNENIDKYINDHVATKFVSSLEDAAVFKQTEQGKNEFHKFMVQIVDSFIE